MPKSVQIRDISDDIYAALQRHAAAAGFSVPELLRREANRLASRHSLEEWLARTERRASTIGPTEVTDALDELRGAWPDARHRR